MTPGIRFDKYYNAVDEPLYVKKGKIVNVVGLTIESAGPDSTLGDVCYIYPVFSKQAPPADFRINSV